MEKQKPKIRKPKCAGAWYPYEKQAHGFKDNPVSSAVIAPHAGFTYSGTVALEAVSRVMKNRVWIFGTPHYETPGNGISVFYGDYCTSIGKAVFPGGLNPKEFEVLEKYLSDTGHRTQEHSIENVLYCLNHFKKEISGFCCLAGINNEGDFERISDDIAKLWRKDDSIIVSTDWNHFVSTEVIDTLMKKSASFLERGEISTLYRECSSGNLEACGIDGLYLACRILTKTHEKTAFEILTSTDSSKTELRFRGLISGTCVGYISAAN